MDTCNERGFIEFFIYMGSDYPVHSYADSFLCVLNVFPVYWILYFISVRVLFVLQYDVLLFCQKCLPLCQIFTRILYRILILMHSTVLIEHYDVVQALYGCPAEN